MILKTVVNPMNLMPCQGRSFQYPQALQEEMFISTAQALVRCPCAFPTAQARTKSAPRRGSQALGLGHFHYKFSHKRALVEILLNSSLRGPCMILCRSSTEDLVEILVRSCLRGPWMKILQVPCLFPAAAVAIMPNLICYCFIAAVACIWYIDFLPPTLFGVSCRCNF